MDDKTTIDDKETIKRLIEVNNYLVKVVSLQDSAIEAMGKEIDELEWLLHSANDTIGEMAYEYRATLAQVDELINQNNHKARLIRALDKKPQENI